MSKKAFAECNQLCSEISALKGKRDSMSSIGDIVAKIGHRFYRLSSDEKKSINEKLAPLHLGFEE
jgi:hypothetical protein